MIKCLNCYAKSSTPVKNVLHDDSERYLCYRCGSPDITVLNFDDEEAISDEEFQKWKENMINRFKERFKDQPIIFGKPYDEWHKGRSDK